MKYPRASLFAALAIIFFGSFYAAGQTVQQRTNVRSKPVVITNFTNGERDISLRPIPAELTYFIPLTGKTPLASLMVQIEKTGEYAKSVTVPLNNDGTFSFICLLKSGPGKYTVTVFGSSQKNSLSLRGICCFTVTAQESVPKELRTMYLNENVLEFTNSMMGRQVGSGECWDLAQEALDQNGADWERPVTFGILLNPDTDIIRAGDIIQFLSVRLVERLPNGAIQTQTIGMPDHTAVIFKVLGKKHYELAHQNINGVRTVLVSEINLAHIVSGSFRIYRPHAVLLKEP